MSKPEISRRGMLRGMLTIGAAAGATFALAGCQQELVIVPSDDNAENIGAEVYIVDNDYSPNKVTIKKGQAVRWEWASKDRHDVVANDRSFVSELQYEGTYTHIFDEPGEYSYICSVHPEMRGLVIVE
ncbi:cupredoxin domain-containing protein [Leucobacter sp. UCMA 4100]|uniref:cupredoxin domain-containing protein n=1 Tax=Leucobacter sp. UCMA 4100 TaxID=2810534 RepID=UPI0022EA3D9F|nr:cupredoxin domain-containing protein [Leucobacter sp. UCMA 4100]